MKEGLHWAAVKERERESVQNVNSLPTQKEFTQYYVEVKTTFILSD